MRPDDRREDADGEDVDGDGKTSIPKISPKFGAGRLVDMDIDDGDDSDDSARMPLPPLLLFVLLLSIPLCGVEPEALVKFFSASWLVLLSASFLADGEFCPRRTSGQRKQSSRPASSRAPGRLTSSTRRAALIVPAALACCSADLSSDASTCRLSARRCSVSLIKSSNTTSEMQTSESVDTKGR